MQNADFRWDDARVLLALLQEGTLSGAGVRLGLNASTVGRRLDALESVIKGRLFDRTPDGVRPTALAERLRPHAEALSMAALGLSMAAEGHEIEPEGHVRLAAPPGLAEHLLGPALPRLLARYPRIRITLDVGVGYADLTRREVDLALRTSRPTHGDLIAKRLGETEECLICSRAYAAEHGPLLRFDQVRWITFGDELSHLPAARWIAETVPDEAVVLRTDSIGTQLAAAAAGVGVALLVRSYEGVLGLVSMPLSPALHRAMPPPYHRALWLVGHRALHQVPRIAATWAFLEEEARRVGFREDAAPVT